MKISKNTLKKIIMQEARKVLKESSGMMQYSMVMDFDQADEEFPGFVQIVTGDTDEGDQINSDSDAERLFTSKFSNITGYSGPAKINVFDNGDSIEILFIGSKEDIIEAIATWEESRGGSSVNVEEIAEQVEENIEPYRSMAHPTRDEERDMY